MSENYESAIKEWLEKDERITVKPLILRFLRLLGEGKTKREAAELIGKKESNMVVAEKTFRKNFPLFCYVVDTVRREGLLKRTSKKEIRTQILKLRIALAEKGIFLGTLPPGLMRVGNTCAPIPGVFEKVRAVFLGTLEGKRTSELAKETGFSKLKITRIRRNPIYKGWFPLLGKLYKGNWEPFIDPDIWDEVQKRIGPPVGLLFGYQWVNGKKVLRPGAKETYEKIFRMRLGKKSIQEIAKTVGLGHTTVQRILKDMRITGKVEVDGKLVDSGYEPAIDLETWKAVQKMRALQRWEKQAEEFKELKRKIMSLTPAYRWELAEKIGVSMARIQAAVKRLIMEGVLKEERGLLQKSWIAFPEKRVDTRFKIQSLNRRKVLAALSVAEEGLTFSELKQKTGLIRDTLRSIISGLIRDGFIQKVNGKFRLSETVLSQL